MDSKWSKSRQSAAFAKELRLRAKGLLRRIKIEDLWQAGSADLEATGKKASVVLQALSERTGNHILFGDQYGQFDDRSLETAFTTSDGRRRARSRAA